MSVILVFLVVVLGVGGWWLVTRQGLMSRPWLEQGPVEASRETLGVPTARVGLIVFLAVVGALFSLFASAYFMRMELSDWSTPPLPGLVWFTTAVLALSSLALHFAVVAARRGQVETLRLALVTGGLTATVFLFGQTMAWRELAAAGYYASVNPANGFFYLLTGMHGLHIAGGVLVLGRTTVKSWDGAATPGLRLAVELCATYWHFLLFVWVAILVLLAGWANGFIEICRQLLT